MPWQSLREPKQKNATIAIHTAQGIQNRSKVATVKTQVLFKPLDPVKHRSAKTIDCAKIASRFQDAHVRASARGGKSATSLATTGQCAKQPCGKNETCSPAWKMPMFRQTQPPRQAASQKCGKRRFENASVWPAAGRRTTKSVKKSLIIYS